MPIQAPQWTEFLSCPVCYNVFNEQHYRPISLACGHTVCRMCLSKFQQRKCPFDQSLITRDIDELPANFALLQLVCATASPDNRKGGVPEEYKRYYEKSRRCVEEMALLLKPVSSSSTGSIISVSTPSTTSPSAPACVLSRPMQRKLITLVSCQLVEDEGRARALRAARSLGERTVTELILQHQNPQQLSSNLWAAVRGRGCQFLGPGMQEEVLKLILLALEDGSALSRKVLVLFVVQRLEAQYPQASKTAIGHVVQLLYRASCFKVTKRDEESSLMQLKEEYRTYEALRREHDSQVVQIAMEAALRIAPDQWSSLLYGDSTHKSHMQSIIDKLQTPQTFSQSVNELVIALQRTNDPHNLTTLKPELEFLSNIDPSPDVPSPTWENLEGVMRAVRTVIEGLVIFLQSSRKPDLSTAFNTRYKTSLCRDFLERGNCPRANSCTFAHSEEELEKYRQKSKKGARGTGVYMDDERSKYYESDIEDEITDLSMSDNRGGYSHKRFPPLCPPPPPPQLVPPTCPPPQLAPPPGPPPQLAPPLGPPPQLTPPCVPPPQLVPPQHPPSQLVPPPQLVTPLDVPQLAPPPYLAPHPQLTLPKHLDTPLDAPQLAPPPHLAPHPQLTLPKQLDTPLDVPQLAPPPQLAPHLQLTLPKHLNTPLDVPQLAPPPHLASTLQLAPPTQLDISVDTSPAHIVDNVAMGVVGNIALPLVEILMPSNRDFTSPTDQPTAGYVMPSPGYVMPTPGYVTPTPGYVTPTPGYVTPTLGYVTPTPSYVTPIDYTPTFIPPNGDCAILHTGKVIPAVGDMLLQQAVAPRMVQSQMSITSIAQGVVQPGVNQGLMQSGRMTPAMPPVPPSMPQMPGMMHPYTAPYGAPGSCMIGPRFPMQQFMYGQYSYPTAHPYMTYYPQGIMSSDNSQMQCDNYYTSLNPCAEPWKPSSSSGPSVVVRPQYSGSIGEICSLCNKVDQEEQRRRQHGLCDKHKTEPETKLEADAQCRNNVNANNQEEYLNEKVLPVGCQEPTGYQEVAKPPYLQQSQDGHKQNVAEEPISSTATMPKYRTNENKVICSNGDQELPEWSTNDDIEFENENINLQQDLCKYEQMENGNTPSTDEPGDTESDYEQHDTYDQVEHVQLENWPSLPGRVESANQRRAEKKDPLTVITSKIPVIPIMAEPNTKLYRQSITNLRERRSTLIHQLQEINIETTAHEHKLEELSESLPNLFKHGKLGVKEYRATSAKEVSVYNSTLKHPHPLDTGPYSLKSAAPTNGEIFDRLGAISGVPPRSVNDSIIASWTANTLKYSVCDDANAGKRQSGIDCKPELAYDPEYAPVSGNMNKDGRPPGSDYMEQDFPYLKDITQNLDSPMTTPPSTPCPSSTSVLHTTSRGNSYPVNRTCTTPNQYTKNIYNSISHKSETNYGRHSSIYGQSVRHTTKTSSYGSGAYGSKSSVSEKYSTAAVTSSNQTRRYQGDVYSPILHTTSAIPDSLSSPAAVTGSSSVADIELYPPSYDVKTDSYTTSDTLWSTASYSTAASVRAPQASSQTYITAAFGSSPQLHTTSSMYRPLPQAYPVESVYGSTTQPYSSASFYGLPSTEDHIPFVEGSPIISKFGPISRNTSRNINHSQPVGVIADDAMGTVPVTAVTPLAGPPLPNAQRVPSRFTRTQDGSYQLYNSTQSTTVATYEKSYSLWTTEVNMLEQKAKKASTEDELLNCKLLAVQMQITLKEQELQQSQLLETSRCSEYLKTHSGPWNT